MYVDEDDQGNVCILTMLSSSFQHSFNQSICPGKPTLDPHPCSIKLKGSI